MKKFLLFLCAVSLVLGLVVSASATPIYFEADNVLGTGTITYGIGTNINNPPEFTFKLSSSTDPNINQISQNLSSFTPGEYTISLTLTGFWADYDENDMPDFTLPNVNNFTIGPIYIPDVPLTGTYGALSWNVNPNSDFWVSYNFDVNPGPNSNKSVNESLAKFDLLYSTDRLANGVMDANIGWEKFRVELNPVPEPSTVLLLGLGLIGMAGYGRKRFSKKA